MRKFLYWQLPLFAALIAASVFAYGFTLYLRGDRGTPVDYVSAAATPEAPQAMIAPIILGDSLARGAGDQSGLGIAGRLDAELRRRNVSARRTYNVAVNGARTRDLMEVLTRPNVRTLLGQSNVIILSIGGNDLWGGNNWSGALPPDPDAAMNEVLDRVAEAIGEVRKANPKARVFFVGLYNPFVTRPEGKRFNALVNRWNARLLERFGGDPEFTLVQTYDLFSHRERLAMDRFHPSGQGYELIARRIADAL